MSVTQLFSNNAVALLETSIGPTDLSINLQTGLGEYFPQPVNPGDFFLITLETIASPLTREIVKIIGRSGDTLIVDPSGRAWENPNGLFPAQSWTALETLVDHRITAYTIKQAFLQPTPSSGGSGGIIYSPVIVDPSSASGLVTVQYSDYSRFNKFWVSMVDDVTGESQALEILSIIQGLLSTNDESVDWVQTTRIGTNFIGTINIALDTTNKLLTLAWYNGEPAKTVTVSVTSI